MSNDSSTPAFEVTDETMETTVVDRVEKKMRVIVHRHPNPDITTYHVNRRLTESLRSLNFVNDSGEVKVDPMFTSVYGTFQNVEPFAQSLAEKLLRVLGIQGSGFISGGLGISSYEIRVSKGSAFLDTDIEPAVIAIIAESFDLTVGELDQSIKDERHLLYRNQAFVHEMAESKGMFDGFSDDLP